MGSSKCDFDSECPHYGPMVDSYSYEQDQRKKYQADLKTASSNKEFAEGQWYNWRDKANALETEKNELKAILDNKPGEAGRWREKYYDKVAELNKADIKIRILHDNQLRTYDGLTDKADKYDDLLVHSDKLAASLEEFNEFLATYGENAVLWGNGSVFDNSILLAAARAVGMKLSVKFWNHLCYRTIKTMNPDVKFKRIGTYHNALDDAKSQALHFVEIMNS